MDRVPDIAKFVVGWLDAGATGMFRKVSMARCRKEQMLIDSSAHLILYFNESA
jgi:hypothetical protein